MPYLVMGLAQGTGAPATPANAPSINLQHMDNTVDDDSAEARTWTVVGSPLYGTEAKFAPRSWNMFTGSAYMTTPYTADLCPWTATSFSIDCWVWMTGYTNQVYAGGQPVLIGNMNPTGNVNNWSFGLTNSGEIRFYYYNGSPQYHTDTGSAIPTSEWVHLAVTISSGQVRLFVNGTKKVDAAHSGSATYCGGQPLTIGQYFNTNWDGYVDEVRITRDQPVWTDNFTPNSSAYTS